VGGSGGGGGGGGGLRSMTLWHLPTKKKRGHPAAERNGVMGSNRLREEGQGGMEERNNYNQLRIWARRITPYPLHVEIAFWGTRRKRGGMVIKWRYTVRKKKGNRLQSVGWVRRASVWGKTYDQHPAAESLDTRGKHSKEMKGGGCQAIANLAGRQKSQGRRSHRAGPSLQENKNITRRPTQSRQKATNEAYEREIEQRGVAGEATQKEKRPRDKVNLRKAY